MKTVTKLILLLFSGTALSQVNINIDGFHLSDNGHVVEIQDLYKKGKEKKSTIKHNTIADMENFYNIFIDDISKHLQAEGKDDW